MTHSYKQNLKRGKPRRTWHTAIDEDELFGYEAELPKNFSLKKFEKIRKKFSPKGQ